MGGPRGEGEEFGADLFYLFLAGKVFLPRTARTYESLAWQVDGLAGDLRGVGAELMNPAGFDQLEGVRQTLQWALGTTAVHVDEAGDALVQIATSYATTDAAAAEVFTRKRGELTGQDATDAAAPDTDPAPPE